MSYEFLHSAMSQSVGSFSSATTREGGQRFSALVELPAQSKDVYVNGSATADVKGAFVKFLAQFESHDIPTHALQNTDEVSRGYASENGNNAADEFKAASHDALQAQAEMLRTMMMMEMMSTAKQGVTTLFQQQG